MYTVFAKRIWISSQKQKYFCLMFLYERFCKIWIMQLILLSRLKPDLCKTSGRLLKYFVCLSSRQVFMSEEIFCLYYLGYILMTFFYIFFHLSRSSFLHFLHFRGKYLLVEKLGCVIQGIILICWQICFVLKEI